MAPWPANPRGLAATLPVIVTACLPWILPNTGGQALVAAVLISGPVSTRQDPEPEPGSFPVTPYLPARGWRAGVTG